ncbi:MAG TPA: hypothetical protein VD866_20565 [Urbifossiella sp.]|nr:hypothetical protein [Urbifossiella sp.]
MAYTDFTLETAESVLGVTTNPGDLFPDLRPAPVPSWLADSLGRGMQLALVSEKARSEFIVAPILLAVREASGEMVAILSGQRLDVDVERRLVGECDFLLTRSEPVPRLRAPLMAVVEAKKNDIDGGLGQCIAQMVAAQVYNERAGQPVPTLYGCVTTGEDWQFLGLTGTAVTLHRPRLYIADVGMVLAAFGRAVGSHRPSPAA